MTAMSINTAYVELGQKVQLSNVVEMAKKMGIPPDTKDLDPEYTSLPLGVIDTTLVAMASVVATFAAKGVAPRAHMIAEVTDNQGNPTTNEKARSWRSCPGRSRPGVSEGVAADATSAMEAVVKPGGTGTRAALGNRPVAGKTGTTRRAQGGLVRRVHAELATASAMWRQDKNGNRKSLVGVGNYSGVYGGTVPADLFKKFMTKALEGKEITPFPPRVNAGRSPRGAGASDDARPSSSPSPTDTPDCRPGQPNQPAAGRRSRPPGHPVGSASQGSRATGSDPVGCNPGPAPEGTGPGGARSPRTATIPRAAATTTWRIPTAATAATTRVPGTPSPVAA